MSQFSTEKYIFKPHPYSSHTMIISWLEKYPKGTKILDIGTTTGCIGKIVQHKGFELYGLEPEAEWSEVARPFYRDILSSELEHAESTYLSVYQVVLLADVLEYIPKPEKELLRLTTLQPNGSIFIISVPNIANLWVRLNLLFGKFDYTDRGIMDFGHQCFITRTTFLALLKQNGLQISTLHVTPIPIWLVNPFFVNTWAGEQITDVLMALTRFWRTVFGYQWIAQCEVMK